MLMWYDRKPGFVIDDQHNLYLLICILQDNSSPWFDMNAKSNLGLYKLKADMLTQVCQHWKIYIQPLSTNKIPLVLL